MVKDNIWETFDETTLPTVTIYLNMIDVTKLNSSMSVNKVGILPDGREIEIKVLLNTDRETFSEDIKNIKL